MVVRGDLCVRGGIRLVGQDVGGAGGDGGFEGVGVMVPEFAAGWRDAAQRRRQRR